MQQPPNQMQPGQGQVIMQDAQFQVPGVQQQQQVYLPMDTKLMQLDGVLIKQKFDLLEGLTGCERPNIYFVYMRNKKDKDKKKGPKLFKYKEKSSFYDRCLTGSCKPFKMKCQNEQQMANDENCMRCEKECACTYMCCNRTEMKCFYTELKEHQVGEEMPLGKCYDPWDCMNFSFKIYTQHDTCEYFVLASCCQAYFWCRCPCEKCQLVVFMIHEGESKSGPIVGELRRTGRDCLKQAVMGDDADEFSVDFPEKSDWRQRAMLMNLVVFIDYTMFEDTSANKQNQPD